jgi:hypothetical protein
VHRFGVQPASGWPSIARTTFQAVTALPSRLERHPRPLTSIKNAWRHMIFYLSQSETTDYENFHSSLSDLCGDRGDGVQDALRCVGEGDDVRLNADGSVADDEHG